MQIGFVISLISTILVIFIHQWLTTLNEVYVTSHSSHFKKTSINQNWGSLEPFFPQILHSKLKIVTNLLPYLRKHVKLMRFMINFLSKIVEQ